MLARIFAEHIRNDYGFSGKPHNEGKLLGYLLTKAGAMSPALKVTDLLLLDLMANQSQKQELLFG